MLNLYRILPDTTYSELPTTTGPRLFSPEPLTGQQLDRIEDLSAFGEDREDILA